MKKIVIIGATGEIGAYITDYFAKCFRGEYEIVAVGRRTTEFFERYGIKYFSIDISNRDAFDCLPQEDVYAVVFTAAMMPGRMEGYTPEKYISTNVLGTLNVMEYCRKIKVDRVLYTQTIRDVGNKIGREVIHSDDARDFSYVGDHAMYTITKNAAVDIIEHYYQEYGIKRFIFRLPTVYMYTENDMYCVNGVKRKMGYRILIDQAIEGKSLEVWGDPTKAHDVLYIKDLCRLFELACRNTETDGGVYNAGTGCPVSIDEQIEGIIAVFSEGKSEKVYVPEKGSARQYIIDISKTKKELGYQPAYDYLAYLEDFKKEMQEKRFAELEK